MKKLWILLLLPFLMGAAPTKTTTFSSQTTIRSSEVNTNFDDLYNYLSVGVDTLRSNAVDAIGEINSSIRTGSDSFVVTGTKGSTTEMCIWNSDGDAIGLSQITGNTTGMGVPGIRITDAGFVSCTNLGTNSVGRIICN